MRAGHGKNVGRAIDQRRSQRLTAQTADVHASSGRTLHGMQTGRLTAHGIDAGGSDFDVFAIAEQGDEKALPPSDFGRCFRYKQRGHFSQFPRRPNARDQPRIERFQVNEALGSTKERRFPGAF